MKTRGQLKSEAKSVLNGRWKDSVLMCLVPTLISIAFAVVIVVIVVLPLIVNPSMKRRTQLAVVAVA